MKYEVQYSSYVNVTLDGFVILKRAVKTESFALQVTEANFQESDRASLLSDTLCFPTQLRAVDTTTGEFGTAALSVQVIPGETI